MRAGVIIAAILFYVVIVGLYAARGDDMIASDRRPAPRLAAIF